MPDESVTCCVSLCVCGFQCCSNLQIDTDRCPGTLAVFPAHSELAVLVSPICPRLHQVFDVSAVGNQVRQVVGMFRKEGRNIFI